MRRLDWFPWAWPPSMVAVCTALNSLIFPYVPHTALVLVYLLGVVAVAARSGPGPSVLACVLSVAAFDFFLVPPYYTFAVAETQDLLTFGAMFVVALVISGLTVRIRWLADSARQREARTAALYAMSRDLASAREVPAILAAARGNDCSHADLTDNLFRCNGWDGRQDYTLFSTKWVTGEKCAGPHHFIQSPFGFLPWMILTGATVILCG